MTFAEFVTAVTASVFPEGQAENLVASHRKYITDALIDLQQKIPRLRVQHEDHTTQANTLFSCGATILGAPRGFLAKIWTITETNCCSRVDYSPVDIEDLRSHLVDLENCGSDFTPDDSYATAYEDYPTCLYYADPSGSVDKSARASSGIVALHRGELHLYPHIQSDEIVVVEWDGIKRSWQDSETVVFDREIERAVEYFLEAEAARRDDTDYVKAASAEAKFRDHVARLIWQENKENRIPKRIHQFTNCDLYTGCTIATSSGSSTTVIADEIMEPVVNTYAELRANVNPARYTSVKVLGRNSAFDGDGGIYIRRSQTTPATADNNSTILVSTYNSNYYWLKWL